jgi:L-isoleucine 31-dioxygenase
MTSSTLSTLLSGARIENNFSCLETSAAEADTEIIHDIITSGHHNGAVVYVIRGAFRPESAARVVENFDRLLAETSGGNRHDDGFVRTNQIGATQFSRTGEEYVREVIQTSSTSLDLLDGVSHDEVERMFNTELLEKVFAKKGIVFRSSRFKNMPGGFCTLRRWLDNGEMALMPHEDTAQLLAARADGYEIAGARHVVSYNAAVEATDEGGSLVVWNLNPDDRCRENLGVVGTGYPYPPGELAGLESFIVQLHQGDAYFLNSSFIHGVSSLREGRRLSAGRFIGQVADDLVVYWT